MTDADGLQLDRVAREVRESGAQIVVVHGKRSVSEVTLGTNAVAVRSRYVDVLEHPGKLALADAVAAAEHCCPRDIRNCRIVTAYQAFEYMYRAVLRDRRNVRSRPAEPAVCVLRALAPSMLETWQCVVRMAHPRYVGRDLTMYLAAGCVPHHSQRRGYT